MYEQASKPDIPIPNIYAIYLYTKFIVVALPARLDFYQGNGAQSTV